MTLYEINNAILECVDMETGEIIDSDKLSELQMAFDEKIENVALWIKDLKAEAEAIKKEADALTQRRKVCENKAESLKGYLINALGGQKFKTAKVSISYRKSEAVEVEDIGLIDDDYLKFTEPTADKTKIKKALKEGVELKGVKLVENQSIQIK